MDTTTATSTALGVLGIGLVLEAMVRMFRSSINVATANAALKKLLDAGNLDRASKLVRAAPPGSIYDAYADALAAGQATRSRDSVTIAAATHPAYDRAGSLVDARWRRTAERGLVGTVLGLGGAAFEASMHVHTAPVTTLAGLALLGGIWHVFHRGDLGTALAIGRDDILPSIDRALTQHTD